VVEINTGPATNDQSLKTSLVNTDIPIVSVSASSTYSTWDASNAIDNNTATIWSSGRKVSISDVEFIQFQFSGANDVNYVKLTPRYGSNNAGVYFPLNFTIYYYTGARWVSAKSFTNFANPQKNGQLQFAGYNTAAGYGARHCHKNRSNQAARRWPKLLFSAC
jgi:WD40 repeat protein